MSNAIKDITTQAEVLIDQITEKENNRIQNLVNDYLDYMKDQGDFLMEMFEESQTELPVFKRVKPDSLTCYLAYKFNREFKGTFGRTFDYRDYTRTSVSQLAQQINLGMDEKRLGFYLEDFKEANRRKLDNALEKRLNENMEAFNIELKSGPKGVEVHSDIKDEDGNIRKFQARTVLAGGYVQVLHYRYYVKLSVPKNIN